MSTASGEAGASRTPGPDAGQVLCRALTRDLPVSGASISVVTDTGHHSIVGATDELAAQLEAWQFDLGVGPHWEALRTERPAFLYDLHDTTQEGAWPALVAEMASSGAAALFAFPLRLADGVVGVADLYSREPAERWSDETIRRAEGLALRVSAGAVRLATASADADVSRTGAHAVELRREVHQATGVVMAQLDCDAETALLRLRARAFADGVPLLALAREVVARRVDLSVA
jgi:hypothetical protein